VLNKMDLVPEKERKARIKAFVAAYRWTGPVFAISAVNGEGCRELVYKVQDWLDAHPAPAPVAPPSSDAAAAVPATR
jgi:GTP-binding protein